jgi:hypothetical protein
MTEFVTAGAGFLLAVLWFDLMFDVQVRLSPGEESVGSIATYYARVTTAARPMNRLVAVVMLATLAAIVAQIVHGEERAWVAWTSLVLLGAAVAIAATRTVPAAVRLGARRDPPEQQSALASSILREHIACLALVAAMLALQLAFA